MSNRSVQKTSIASKSRLQLSIEYIVTGSLNSNANNPRVHTPKQVNQIARSIETFGFNVPVLVDDDLNVIAGHGRLMAARLLELTTVPVIKLEHLSQLQRQAFLIADNRLTENSSWDDRLLGEQLKILSEAEIDFTLESTGFEMAEIDIFIENLSVDAGAQLDRADRLELPSTQPQVSQAGDFWLLGKHRVFCGDALDADVFKALMRDKKAALVFTDPPYNVRIDGHASGLGKVRHKDFRMASGEMTSEEFTTFLTRALGNAVSHCVNGSLHFVCMDWRHVQEISAAGASTFSELKNICVWNKSNAGMGSLYRSQHEFVFVFKYGEASHRNNIQLGSLGRYRTNVWNYPSISSLGRATSEGNLLELHPTVKPVAMVADAILDCSARGDIVIDPFVGSGTTVIAAERTGRICYGIELDPLYVDTIVRRWQRFTGKLAIHKSSNKSFKELEEVVHAQEA